MRRHGRTGTSGAATLGSSPRAVLLDLLMATMNSVATWSAVAGDAGRGLAWRDAVTRRMVLAGAYVPYEELVDESARELGLAAGASNRLWSAWPTMQPWPDSRALRRVEIPVAFLTNCSRHLAHAAARRTGLQAAFVLSAEEAGWYKPHPETYRQASERLGLAGADVRYVAGAAYDADGALAAGMDAWLVQRRPLDRLPADAVRVVQRIDQALPDR